MGRRAKKAPVQTKKKIKLSKRFKCPFCANEDTVECKMDFKMSIGSLNCRLCGANYQMPIHHLHEPIDVFSEWLDDCEAAANPRSAAADATAAAAPRYDDEDDDDLPEGSGLQRGGSAPKPAAAAAASKKSVDLGLSSDEEDD
mmetsp:Transcript_6572/g.13731  ORF Transcript_6572/g.13731 Transcript_6572/m.13731 type:complete len:143 (-) Transcript_6572:309-737(-)|eukprot:CAMPEP_0172442234 /NCGR_PEP_ID=MMETSP1065-20121228/2708_1 /TAXON_ID=265537 /ORGANISM="Amphiprora paludosa, Strain CCMP125" /LENGTH=142 /DNA_ID=CAMNT_0013192021 /DNA_START=105 /DNA_END=533 /DNA_ORIENTATION=+